MYTATDYIYKHVKRIVNDKSLVVVSGDKESCVVLIDQTNYQDNLQKMVDDGIKNGIYKVAEDNTLKDLKLFKSFLYRSFRKYEHYEEMLPKSNQPGQLYGTTKTHRFNNINEIIKDNLKFRPIIAQTGTYTYNTAQFIAEYHKSLCSGNNDIIRNTQEFFTSLKQQDPLLPDEEYISYDVESLFTNVPVHETIEYILQEIYVKEKLPKICFKLIMNRLLLKLTTENTFMLNSNFYKQTDGCTMGGTLSVIFSHIYMTKTEEDVAKPTNQSFYKRFVDEIISKKKKDQPDLLFENLNNHHPNINYTIEKMLQKFLDANIIYEDNEIKTKVQRNERKLCVHWTSKNQNVISGMLSTLI